MAFSFKVADACIDARPGSSKLVLSFYKVLVQSRILHRMPNDGEFYPVSGFQHPASIPASTTTNRFLHLQFSGSKFNIFTHNFRVVGISCVYLAHLVKFSFDFNK